MADDLSEGFVVTGPSGAVLPVLNEIEVKVYEESMERYLHDNRFTNVSDLRELDRILTLELMCHRWGTWLTSEMDYEGGAIDPKEVQKQIKEFSTELRGLKKALGIDKASRDKDKGESIAQQWDNLLVRAKEFGYHREEQLTKALTLFNELTSLVILHDNCLPDERKDLHCTSEEILSWVRDTAIPEYKAIDEHFAGTRQRFWVRDL